VPQKYAVWNNKGGVGKTFLTFVMATEYAQSHEDEQVVVVDMCPQANVSEILLGGGADGAKALEALLKETPRRSIGGYFDTRIASPHKATSSEADFVTRVEEINPRAPKNIGLVAGDPSLEIQSQAINQIAAQTLPQNSWKNVHSWVIDLINGIEESQGDTTFFIDCNPSFSAYSELAILASDRLIVPCTADGSSARAIDNIGQLLYGHGVPTDYKQVNFSAKAQQVGLQLPEIHVVPFNRSTQYDKKAAKAFGAMHEEIKGRVKKLGRAQKGSVSGDKANLFLDIPDTHSVAVVCSHKGLPLHKLKAKRYEVHGVETQVNPEPLERYRKAAAQLVARL